MQDQRQLIKTYLRLCKKHSYRCLGESFVALLCGWLIYRVVIAITGGGTEPAAKVIAGLVLGHYCRITYLLLAAWQASQTCMHAVASIIGAQVFGIKQTADAALFTWIGLSVAVACEPNCSCQ